MVGTKILTILVFCGGCLLLFRPYKTVTSGKKKKQNIISSVRFVWGFWLVACFFKSGQISTAMHSDAFLKNHSLRFWHKFTQKFGREDFAFLA